MSILLLFFILLYPIYLATGGWKAILISISFILLSILILLIRNKIISKKYFKKLNFNYKFIREVPEFLDVNDILFLNNKNFSSKKNIKLILMQLNLKGLIDIKKENNKIIITRIDKMCNLSNAENYILNYIDSNDKKIFSKKQYNECVKEDILEKGLAYDKKDLSFFKFYFFFSSIIFLIFTYLYVSNPFNDLDISIIMGFILIVLPNGPLYYIDILTNTLILKLTDKGYACMYLTNSYKKFLQDFSNIKNLKNENYPLWQKHLLYAQALNANLNYNKIPDIGLNLFTDIEINNLFN